VLGPLGSGPVHIQVNPSNTTVLQLEAEPTGRSSGCFSTGLKPDERGYANPPDRSCPQKALVAPVQVWYTVILEMLMVYPRLILPQENLVHTERTGSPKVGHNPSVSRLACLREKY